MLPQALDNQLIMAVRERDAAKTRLEIIRKGKKTFDKEMSVKWNDLNRKLKTLREDELRHEQFSLVIMMLNIIRVQTGASQSAFPQTRVCITMVYDAHPFLD